MVMGKGKRTECKENLGQDDDLDTVLNNWN
jgi:hypothetical protein